MNKILVLRIETCEDRECDYTQRLVNVSTGDVLLEGDYYHDHITEKIDGFIEGLKFAGHQIIKHKNGKYICENCQLFEEVDTNKDGKISQEEIDEALKRR